MSGEPEKKAVLEYLTQSLSFAKTLEQFPNLELKTLRGWILESTEIVEEKADDMPDDSTGADIFEANIDGASRGNPGPAAAGVVLKGAGNKWEFAIPLGITTNNVAEYEALIIALKEAKKLGASEIRVRSDSELMVKQISGAYKVKDEKLQALYSRVKKLTTTMKCTIKHVPREQNKEADKLANMALDEAQKKKA